MGTKLRIAAFLICIHASEVTKAQTPWKIKTASIYEIDFYDSEAKNFSTAKKLCEDNLGIMVRLDDEEVRNTVYATIPSASVKFFWIGAIGRLNNWKWLDGTRVEGSILNWVKGQPDNYNHGDGNGTTRLIIQKKDNKYGDVDYRYNGAGTICLRDIVLKVSNSKLTIYRYDSNGNTMAVNYETAKSRCSSMFSRLAVVDGSTRSTLNAKLKNNEFHWVGTTATGGCKAFAKNLLTTISCYKNLPYVCEQVRTYGVTTSDLHLTATSEKRISCTARGFPIPSVVWKKDGVRVSVSSTGGVYQTSGDGLARLRLENAHLTDEGEYKCVARNTIDGTMYRENAIAQLKVLSKPTILIIEPQSCNSSFIIRWKPHQRAIGVEHTIQIYQHRRDWYTTYAQQVTLTPNAGEQFFVSKNLTSSTLYNVVICVKTYWNKKQNYTRGVPKSVQTARLSKANEHCKVNWNWPENTPKDLLTGFKVKTIFTTARVAAGTKVLTQSEEVITTSLSIDIPLRPNRNHTVTITSQTCAGFGKAVVAEGVCVTNVEAPTVVSKPYTGAGAKEVSEEGELIIKIKIPSQTNGPVSCIFVVVETGIFASATGFDESGLRNANGTEGGSRHIAIAMDQQSIRGSSELDIILGDTSTTRCSIYGQQKMQRNIDGGDDGDGGDDDAGDDVYVGQNSALSKIQSYGIFLVTSTPSDSEVFFQISDSLKVQDRKMVSLALYIGPTIALVILIAIICAGVCFAKRRGKPNGSDEEDSEHTYEYPTVPIVLQEQPGYQQVEMGTIATRISDATYGYDNDIVQAAEETNDVYETVE